MSHHETASDGLRGKVALITGASAGIGEATAHALARRGCGLILAARRLELLERLSARLELENPGVPALPLRLDVSDRESVQDAVRAGLDRFARIDILVNNAGIGRLDWLEKLDPVTQVAAQIEVNLLGPILMARAVLPAMMARREGHILNVASVAALIAPPTYSVYSASKFGLRGFSEGLRREVQPWGIRVSVLCPGPVRTDFANDGVERRKTPITTPRWLQLTAAEVGEAIAGLILRPRPSLVIPAILRPAVALNGVAPGFIDWLTVRFFVLPQRPELGARPSAR